MNSNIVQLGQTELCFLKRAHHRTLFERLWLELITYLNEFGKWLVLVMISIIAICSASNSIVDMPMPLHRLLLLWYLLL